MPAVQLKDYAGAKVSLSETAPVDPDIGVLWWNTLTGRLYVWYGDVDSAQWVETSPQGIDENIFVNAAGDTMTGTLTVQTLNTTTLNGGQLAGLRNKIINGDFRFWQRATSHSSVGYGSVDRWYSSRAGTTCTMSLQSFTVGGESGVPGAPPNFLRMDVGSVAGAGNYSLLAQRIEFVQTLANQEVTVSFYAKANAAKSIAVELTQLFGTGGSTQVDTSLGKVSIGTTWDRYSFTFTLPSIAGKTIGSNHSLILAIWMDAGSTYAARTDTLGQQSGTFDFWGVQVEPGPVATPFEERPYGLELSLCQRYYTLTRASSRAWAVGAGQKSSNYIYLPVTMRVTPTAAGPTGASNLNVSAAVVLDVLPTGARFEITAAAANDFYSLNGLCTFDAEL